MTLLMCKGLTKKYDGRSVLKNISFDIHPGRPVALVGPNGAGKSTLFSLISGFIQPDSGEILVDGRLAGEASVNGILSALPQDAVPDPQLPVHRQLVFLGQLQGMTKTEAVHEADRVLELTGLTGESSALTGELSHGMNKRVCLAQSLLGKPRLVLLDEPTAGLDPGNARRIRNIIQSLERETTFFISSHNLDELERVCDRVIQLNQGEILRDGLIGRQETSLLTIDLMSVAAEATVPPAALSVRGVMDIKQQNSRWIVEYDAMANPDADIHLMQCLRENNMMYRQIIRGQTLEDQLYGQE